MASETFFISDTHFGHEKCWAVFKRADGTPLRPFSSTEEMDEAMVENWNRVVRPGDVVWHLGDVVMKRKALQIVRRLNGQKHLVAGNHDNFRTAEFLEVGFEQVTGLRVFAGDFICSHVPLHPNQLARFRANVHGHLHDKVMDDQRYLNISVERMNYTPVPLYLLRERITAALGSSS